VQGRAGQPVRERVKHNLKRCLSLSLSLSLAVFLSFSKSLSRFGEFSSQPKSLNASSSTYNKATIKHYSFSNVVSNSHWPLSSQTWCRSHKTFFFLAPSREISWSVCRCETFAASPNVSDYPSESTLLGYAPALLVSNRQGCKDLRRRNALAYS